MARIELSNIGGGTTLSLTTTGTSGAATLAGSVLNIPVYQGQLTLTTTGTSGAATLSGDVLNIPQYSGGGGTPAGSAGQVQFNSTPAGSFAASANLAWDNSNVRLNIGAPSAPTGRLNVKGSGTLTTVNTRLTNSGDTELLKVLDNGNTNIGTSFNWDNANGRLGIGTATPSYDIDINKSASFISYNATNPLNTGQTGVYLRNNSSNFSGFTIYGSSYSGTFLGGLARANAGGIEWNGVSVAYFRVISSTPFVIGTNDLERLRISAAGDVSIGTTSSSARLHVRGANTTAGVGAFLVENSTPAALYRVDNDGKISYLATNTAAGTTGAQTINRPSGTVNFGIGASALVVTNSLCTANSIIFATVRTNDATAYIKNVVPAALGGSFTINLGAAATAETSVGFFIIN